MESQLQWKRILTRGLFPLVMIILTFTNCKISNDLKGLAASSDNFSEVGSVRFMGDRQISEPEVVLGQRFCNYLDLMRDTNFANDVSQSTNTGGSVAFQDALHSFRADYNSCTDQSLTELYSMSMRLTNQNLSYALADGLTNHAIYNVLDSSDDEVDDICSLLDSNNGSFIPSDAYGSEVSGRTYFVRFAEDQNCYDGADDYLCAFIDLGVTREAGGFKIVESKKTVIFSVPQSVTTTSVSCTQGELGCQCQPETTCEANIPGNPNPVPCSNPSDPFCTCTTITTCTKDVISVADAGSVSELNRRGVTAFTGVDRACDNGSTEQTLVEFLGFED